MLDGLPADVYRGLALIGEEAETTLEALNTPVSDLPLDPKDDQEDDWAAEQEDLWREWQDEGGEGGGA